MNFYSPADSVLSKEQPKELYNVLQRGKAMENCL